MVVENAADNDILQQLRFRTRNRMHQQVDTFSIANQVLTEPCVTRNQDGSAPAIDTVAVGRLDLSAVIHFKCRHTNAISFIDHAI